MLYDEKIFITGGAGYLGTHLVKRLYEHNEITIFSRDEAKHYYLKKQFPKVKCIIGDVRNRQLLTDSARGHTIGIFTASLKQIEAVDDNVEEGLQVIVHGAINSRKAATQNDFKAATFISTDKSRAPTTIYGAMKYVAGEAFIVGNELDKTRLSSVIYGNVLNSTGSIIPLIWDSIKSGYELTLYGEEMTRFMIDADEAVDCIEYALGKDGFNIIPNLKSFKVKDLFEIYEKEFRLKWKLGTPRMNEKYHEHMISPFERERVTYDSKSNMFLLHNKNVYNEHILGERGLSSEDCCVTKEELHELLKKNNYFAK